MGCGGSKANGATDTASGGATKSGGKSDETKQLMSEYTLGDVLGQGAFGVVYACAEKGTKDFKYAVKMVDKVETPVAEIKKEAEMMKELEHPNVVKFYAVYYEKCFVCIVMDKYGGGDLIEGMQLHWKTKGKIPPYKVVHIVSGMAKAIDHMHSLQYVHRDVKGDNYLTDRKDITDQGCRVLMSDFGTAVKLTTPQQRLKSSCGTKIYWPPEFYAGNYSFKVDVWAMGVIMYGLCDGRFPFKGEQDAKNKMVKLPSSIPALCVEFVLKCLEKDEKKRFSGADMVAHPWIAKNGDAGKDAKTEPDDPSWTPDAEGIQAGAKGANGAQQERRQELLDRMEQPNKKPATSAAVLWNNRFDVNDKRTGKSLRYEWWPMPQVEEQRVIDLSGATKTVAGSGQASKEDVDTVERMLLDHNIDTNKFGKGEAKTLKHFADEVFAVALSLYNASELTLRRVIGSLGVSSLSTPPMPCESSVVHAAAAAAADALPPAAPQGGSGELATEAAAVRSVSCPPSESSSKDAADPAGVGSNETELPSPRSKRPAAHADDKVIAHGSWHGASTPEWLSPEGAHATPHPDRQSLSNPLDAVAAIAGATAPCSEHSPDGRSMEFAMPYHGGIMPMMPYSEVVVNETYAQHFHTADPVETITTAYRGSTPAYTGLLYSTTASVKYNVTEELYNRTLHGVRHSYAYDPSSCLDASARPFESGYSPHDSAHNLKLSDMLHLDGPCQVQLSSCVVPQTSCDAMSNSQQSTAMSDPAGDHEAAVSSNISYGEIPSMGSAGHADGTCKPCAFLYTKGCENAADCEFCHLCEPGEKKRRRKAKMEVRRTAWRWPRPANPWHSGM
eukprot:TRINITY_DN7992_c0_g1_i1.p1 TRINITY_DN7992_c0_g1~~TRINITY_DN7992_c0_g1_i1.p1  ORF type:complete len:841 (-),score=187.90 TRINITY_DN7992_c0_g1_i1:297-2819(-)